MTDWINACSTADIDAEDSMRFDYNGRTYAIYRNHVNEYYCTDGLCTHEEVHLVGGLVMENTIACPKHSSIFDFTTGEVETPPACENLRTYPVKVAGELVMIEL